MDPQLLLLSASLPFTFEGKWCALSISSRGQTSDQNFLWSNNNRDLNLPRNATPNVSRKFGITPSHVRIKIVGALQTLFGLQLAVMVLLCSELASLFSSSTLCPGWMAMTHAAVLKVSMLLLGWESASPKEVIQFELKSY